MENKINKTRKWFLTINQGAECYNSILDILKGIENLQYSIILHDKDNSEQPHYHCVLDYKNARTFDQIQKVFYGADIETVGSMYLVCRYLLHLDDKDKYQYDLQEVITNNNQVEYYTLHNEYEKLDTESLLEKIHSGEISNLSDAVKFFGLKQCNMYRNSIKDLIQENYNINTQSKQIEEAYVSGIENGYNKAIEDKIYLVDENEQLKEALKIYQERLNQANKLIKEYEILTKLV